MQGLDEPVLRSGFLTFGDYQQKLRMMDHPLFLFGMKLYDMPEAVEFFDADFCNTLVVKSDQFENISLARVMQILNQYLNQNGFTGSQLTIGQLKDVSSDFKLENIVVKADFKIQLRFNSFPEALAAYEALEKVAVPSESGKTQYQN